MAKKIVMSEGLKRLYKGDFNTMNVITQNDGSQLITLVKDNDPIIYRFKVKDLYGVNEQVTEHEVINVSIPDHMQKRIKEATKNGSSG